MPIHLAQGPTHSFLNVLVATADVDDVEVGDTVEIDGPLAVDEGTVLEILSDN